ncbi:hypothetical protein DFH11DRAFT_1622701 [Phellopilus nigrolimitatus]|nr:hypothetical protein DFH11DRAFT_1622701 [Phellopilus nigrolimitatus]
MRRRRVCGEALLFFLLPSFACYLTGFWRLAWNLIWLRPSALRQNAALGGPRTERWTGTWRQRVKFVLSTSRGIFLSLSLFFGDENEISQC